MTTEDPFDSEGIIDSYFPNADFLLKVRDLKDTSRKKIKQSDREQIM